MEEQDQRQTALKLSTTWLHAPSVPEEVNLWKTNIIISLTAWSIMRVFLYFGEIFGNLQTEMLRLYRLQSLASLNWRNYSSLHSNVYWKRFRQSYGKKQRLICFIFLYCLLKKKKKDDNFILAKTTATKFTPEPISSHEITFNNRKRLLFLVMYNYTWEQQHSD